MATALAVRPEFIRPNDLPVTCSDARLLEAIQMWLLGQEEAVILETLGVADDSRYKPLNKRSVLPGWHYLADTLRGEVIRAARGRMNRVLNRCFGLIENRLEQGDPIYGPDGLTVMGYRAVKVKDLGNIAAQFYDRLNDEAKEKEGAISQEERMTLRQLHGALKAYTQEKKARAREKVIEVDGGVR